MHYIVSYQKPHKHFIDFELTIDRINTPEIELQLPAWRPGRYELQHFAKNLQKFEVLDAQGLPLFFRKITKDRWQVQTNGASTIRVKYNYYAQQLDAGGTWLDEEMIYINWIACTLYVEGRMNEPYEVRLEIPDHYRIACGLEKEGKVLRAESFYQLVDAPMVASADLQHQTYTTAESGCLFHIWLRGNCKPDWDKIIDDFSGFTRAQIDVFGVPFPDREYHFMLLILPYKHYHGVEHYNSTMIVMGPDKSFNTNEMYEEILGISSHELFHTWNVIRIRPAELTPYDFTQENYFHTGFVAEGITTYYGDYMLAKGGIWDVNRYFKELNKLLKRHFENFGRFNMSVAHSSFDLWLDGYVPGIPHRKTSIYAEGAVACLILDLEIRRHTSNQKSMDDVMRALWEEFGKSYGENPKGYTLEDYIRIVSNTAGTDMHNYFDECIFGTAPLEERLNRALDYIGCELLIEPSEIPGESLFGMRVQQREGRAVITALVPGSPADEVLTLNDEIMAVDGMAISENFNELLAGKTSLTIVFRRGTRIKTITLESTQQTYFDQYTVNLKEDFSEQERENFEKWLLPA